MKKHLLRLGTLCLMFMFSSMGMAETITATWDFTNAAIVEQVVALSGTSEPGSIEAMEANGVMLSVNANGQTIRNNGNSIQTGDGVVFRVPVQSKKDVVTVTGYAAPYFAYSVAGTDATDAVTVYTATAADVAQGYVEIVNKGLYLIAIKVEQTIAAPITATWDFTNADVVAAVVALSGSSEAGTIKAVEDNGILLTVEANGHTIRNNGNSIHTGDGVVFKVPVQGKKDVVTVTGYAAPYFAYSVAGTDATEAVTSYTATAADVAQGYVEVVNKGQYLIAIQVVQTDDDGGDVPGAVDVQATWDYANADVMAATMALSGSSEAGTVKAVEDNGIEMVVEANGASFRNNGNNIQVRKGAVFKIPVKNAGDIVTVKGYPGYSYYTIGSNTNEITNTQDNPFTEYKASAVDAQEGFVAVTSTNDNNYFLLLSVMQYAIQNEDYEAPMLLECFPQDDAADVPVSGIIVLSFNEPIMLPSQSAIPFYGKELAPLVKDNSISFEYSGLDYNKNYTFTLPANSVTDLAGNFFNEDINLTFTTSEHPTNAILPYGQFSHQPWLAKSKQNPEGGWYKKDYNDSEWETISGPICSEKVSAESFYYVTPFFPEYGKYWLRRHFVLSSICSEKVYFYVSHDDDCIVYLNGVEVYNKTTYGTFVVPIDNSLLKLGDNVLAAYVYDRMGNVGNIDYGLYTDADIKSYTADISTDKQQYLSGETVKISGTAVDVANDELEVYVLSNGVKQVIKSTVDAQGYFSTEWVPMSGQMGRFTIGVSYQGTDITLNPVQVDVIGVRRTSNNYITCETFVGVPFTGELEVENPGHMELHFSGVEILSKPESCKVSIDSPEIITAGGRAVIAYTLEGSAPSAGNDWELVQLRISTVEGATEDVTLYTYCHSALVVLVANENQINTTMTKGTSRDYPLYISNHGKGATGKIRLSLPNVAWMTAVTPVELPSLDYGETSIVMLRLTSSDDLPLNVPLTGTIGVNCENGDGISIGYAIEPVSELTGTLIVDVVDEYTEYAESHPHVSGATVEVLHPTTGAVIAQGLTATEGIFSTELPEGYYTISVKAEKHDEYSGYVKVDPGRENTQEVFLSYEAITYSWSMEETEITDEYEITTTATYETNVPKPVLVITLPNKKPVPNEIFPVTVTNHGLINTEHVDLTTIISIGFTIETLNHGTLDVLGPEQSHTFYCVIKDEDGLWDSSCINAYVVADGYYQCYGLQHVQARADMYHCNHTSNDAGGGCGPWPGTGPGSPSFGGYSTVSGGTSGSTTPWISWPCESCPARVKLEIEQTVSMLRPAYRGTLILVNGHESNPITNARLNLTVTCEDGITATDREFATEVESLEAFDGDLELPGNWTLAPGQTGKIKILFIPTQDAAPDNPKRYTFSGTLNCTDPFSGQELTLPLNTTTFTVQSLPNLELTYLMQRDVYGDDPLTIGVTEPKEPAEFALIINNKGNGDANNVKIITEQPKVFENDKGLLINFAITRTQINGKSARLVLSPVIANNFGTIPAHSQTYAQWWLEGSLLGHFISYDVSANHITDYGNANLSLIDTVSIHEMVHGFSLASDVHRGWLVNDIADADDMPDIIYFSDATKERVRLDANVTISKQGNDYLLTLNANEGGWYYGSLADPTNGSLVVTDIIRQSDGATIPTDNVWQTDRTLRDSREWFYENRLHFVSWLPAGGDNYLLTFKTMEETSIKSLFADRSDEGIGISFHNDKLIISGTTPDEMLEVEISNLRGMKRMTVTYVHSGKSIYVGHLPTGVYLVRLNSRKGTSYIKVIK